MSKLFSIGLPLAASIFAPGLGTALGEGILGAGATGASTLGSGLIGAGVGGLTGGGLKGALLGGVTGGLGANLGGLAEAAGLGNVAGAAPGVYGPSMGSGLAGALSTGGVSAGLPSLGGLVGGSGGGGSTFGSLGSLANLAGGLSQRSAIKKAQQQLLGPNAQQMSNLQSFDPSKITSDPGYLFNLQQGQQGLDRSLGAQGGLFSGNALKAASQYNQGYANNAFNDYYQRWANQTGSQNQLLANQGTINSQATMAGANGLTSAISGALNPTSGINSQDLLKKLLAGNSVGTSLYG